MRLLVVLACLTSVACTPVIPFHFAETAEVLDRGAVSLTVAGGGGGAHDVNDCCGGGSVRVRGGLGHKLELGGEVSVIGFPRGGIGVVALAGKLSLKYAPIRYLALLVGVGASGTIPTHDGGDGESGLGADLGLLASTPLLAGVLRFYGGVRGSFVVPPTKDIYRSGGPTEALVIPVGLSIQPHERWRFFVEGGYTGGWSQNRALSGPVETLSWYGGYGAVALAVLWGKAR